VPAVDQHGVEPVPDADRDSTAWQQFWIWFGADISPLAWIVGAIGPQLGLSLVQSIAIMVAGQAAGSLLFGLFAVMASAPASRSSRSDGWRSAVAPTPFPRSSRGWSRSPGWASTPTRC
jgi:cytosine/uracil/thiamine/allantoin permease